MRFNKWCVHWLDLYKRRFIKESTYSSYLFACQHIKCKRKLEKLSIVDLQKVINDMIDKKLSLSTVKHTVTIMIQASRRAYSLGYCKQLDYSFLELPTDKKSKVEALSLSDQRLILSNIALSFYGPFFKFLLFSGMRVGEAIALRWSAIDYKNKIIKIRYTDYRGTEQDTKTVNSCRDIPLTADLYNILQDNFKIGSVYCFTNTMGNKINYRSLLDSWHRFILNIGVTPCGLHALRHTYATNALKAGVNIKVLSEILGHKTVNITLNIYTDIDISDKAAAAALLTDYIKDKVSNERKKIGVI